jgi:hypothetical protein
MSKNCIHWEYAPHAYREDTDKKDKGWALLDEDSAPLMHIEDDPAFIGAIAPAVGEGNGTYKTLSK